MPDYAVKDLNETSYLYVDCTSSMDPDEIGRVMGEAFGRLMAFIGETNITPVGAPMSVYYNYDPNSMAFRAAMPVTPEDAAKAEGSIKAAVTPAGPTLTTTHTGPYNKLKDTYTNAMAHMQREGLNMSAPAWEIYIDDPGETPEPDLRTGIFIALG